MTMFWNIEANDIESRAKAIKLLCLDVDGVMTDGRLYFSNTGDEMKTFDTQDGQGIRLLQSGGLQVAIISGRKSEVVARRARDLDIHILYQGRVDKIVALGELCKENQITPSQIAYLGDDLPDIQVIKQVGLGLAVSNAHLAVKSVAHGITENGGGFGAVREVCDFLLEAQNKYTNAVKNYL